MLEVHIHDNDLQASAKEGVDAFLQLVVERIYEAIGGQITMETLALLGSDQITLLAYHILRDEVMDGGFVQLIHNGYGPFMFNNPFDKAVKAWGLVDLCRMLGKCRKLYRKYGAEIECECSDEEFMAMFEKYDAFDDFDDLFVENEELWTSEMAHYVDEHLEKFATIV